MPSAEQTRVINIENNFDIYDSLVQFSLECFLNYFSIVWKQDRMKLISEYDMHSAIDTLLVNNNKSSKRANECEQDHF